VDRGKQGTKRSTAVDAKGIPLGSGTGAAKAATTRRFWSLPSNMPRSRWELCPMRRACIVGSGYDSGATRERLENLGIIAEISLRRANRPHYRRRSVVWWRGRALGKTPTKS
jgi:hypothetical protein